MSFEKAMLATGEPRADYIQRRLTEGASAKIVHEEINSKGFYGGPEGKTWPLSVVYAQKNKLDALARRTAPKVEAESDDEADLDLDSKALAVPPEFEDILSAEDVAEVHAEARRKLTAKQREQAKKALLIAATEQLEHEARLSAQRGSAKGDNVDVYIDLAPFAGDIRLDGVAYEHGRKYRVPRKVGAVLMEQMQRSWQHEDSLRGNGDRFGRRTLAERGITANNAQQVSVRA